MRTLITKLTIALFMVLVPVSMVSGTAYAACGTPSSSKTQALRGIGETGSNCSGAGVPRIIKVAVQIMSVFIGVAAVIMIIVSGFRYIVSGGESGRVSSAKNTLIYALVGLAIAALAQFLVHFVLNQSTKVIYLAPSISDVA